MTGCGSEQAASGASDGPGAGQVQILSQSVVGPYETVTLRATDPGALRRWLTGHAYAIPPAIGPTIDAYVAEEFDFIALRLRPDCGERSMQPVRIVTKGADPTLPLRMVAAGIGARVGLTLYVISEGRWQPQNFPHAEVETKSIRWDRTQNKSNYEPLVQALMTGHDGRTWVTEYAQKAQVYTTTTRATARLRPRTRGAAPERPASRTRTSASATRRPVGSAAAPSKPFTPCRNGADAGVTTQDAGTTDAGDIDAGDVDAGDVDAGDVDAGD